MFNLQGSEIIFILLIALVVLGPEKLPGAIRRVTSLYAELRKMSSGFQNEFKAVLDEPLREFKSTADLVRNAADPKRIAEEAEREVELEAAGAKKARQARDATAAMEAAGAAHLDQATAAPTAENESVADSESDIDSFADPVDECVETSDGDIHTGTGTESATDTTFEPDDVAIDTADDETAARGLSSVDLEFEPEGKSA